MLEDELDRQLARRFNALDYLRTDEMGLSRIIADLLDPKGKHGQGTMFLKLMLNKLSFGPNRSHTVRVDVEKTISGDRRLDVCVDIDGQHCLAIENKPYAGDQHDQVKDYLDWLKRKYDGRFLLIYLSPTGEPPSSDSIELDELRQRWRGDFFRIAPYYGTEGVWEDEFDDFRLEFSLADWLADCRRNCDVERLRWFLREVETFCTKQVGGHSVASNEVSTLKEFLFSDEKTWASALSIERSLPEIKNEVYEAFLWKIWETWPTGSLANVYTGMDDLMQDYNVTKRCSWLSMYRKSWRSAKNWNSGHIHDQHTQLRLETTPSSDWYIGICCCEEFPEEGRRELEKALPEGKKGGRQWVWWKLIEGEYSSWDELVPTLHRECKEDGGVVLEYFVKEFAKIAEKAIPIINKYECLGV